MLTDQPLQPPSEDLPESTVPESPAPASPAPESTVSASTLSASTLPETALPQTAAASTEPAGPASPSVARAATTSPDAKAGFQCYICDEPSTEICPHCTRDTCNNHICEHCSYCSDCCQCSG